MRPAYGALRGALWLEQGGVYVVAGIRGGGEYGPAWHRAAIRENRPRAYEDFAAVARALVDTGVTTRDQLGATGGSNGGLLMGVMLTRYPELFGALAIAVPLLDMKRYHLLLAGASWMAEYGDPDSVDWDDFLSAYSPYQNIRPASKVRYPPVLMTTSTRDDRVHPGHARKMTAALEAAGHEVAYYENIEGGHAGAADNSQEARKAVLTYEFFRRRLPRRRPDQG
jgi:prolyl oligopeptidase